MPIEKDSYIVNQKDIQGGGGITQAQMEAYVTAQLATVNQELTATKDKVTALETRVTALEGQ